MIEMAACATPFFSAHSSRLGGAPREPCAPPRAGTPAFGAEELLADADDDRFERGLVANMVGRSPAMGRVFDLVAQAGDSEATVLIAGEGGTGKNLVARAIHAASARRGGPFLSVGCMGLPPELLEAELFGDACGGLKPERSGLFVRAGGGSLLLDDIADTPAALQTKVLRALEERRVTPVGGGTAIPFDTRVLATTNRDLEVEIAEKRFREDLYYRLHVASVEVPPLRERGRDILLLARHFVEVFAARAEKSVRTVTADAATRLLAYDWPGNVRELENCMEQAIFLAQGDAVTAEDLPPGPKSYRPDDELFSPCDPAELVTAAELERRYIRRVLTLVSGDKVRAAQILGFDGRTLYRKLERYRRFT